MADLDSLLGSKNAPVDQGRPGRRKPVRARYDAAQTTDNNRRHWASADGLSADAANSPGVRRTLRNRARYEVDNNSYAAGIVRTLAGDMVGTGPRLQMRTDDPVANNAIESAFAAWCKEIGLASKLRTMRRARAVDGDPFAVLSYNPVLTGPVKLDVQLYEAEQISTPDLTLLAENAVDGIVFDSHGNPIEYHLLDYHPGDALWGGSLTYQRIDARFVIHWFRRDRPGQVRGVPEITPALPLFAQLRRYTLAVIAAAETAANFAAFLKSTAPADQDDPAGTPFDTLEIEMGMLTQLPDGQDITQLRAEQPTTTYKEFKHEVLNEIARCLDMPFNVAAGNSSGYNYSSGRLDHQTYYTSIRIDQADAEIVVLDRIFAAWCEEAVLADATLEEAIAGGTSHQWFWDGKEHIDPAKEATAQETRLRNHTTTLAAEYARKGQDWEEQLRQRAKEVALMRELGLQVEQASPAAAAVSVIDGEDV